ncbi:MAG: hypothetical protein KC502_14475 [Myxococcales bacterium]|nr:hypothetical protein [Myxococcales bacterium]
MMRAKWLVVLMCAVGCSETSSDATADASAQVVDAIDDGATVGDGSGSDATVGDGTASDGAASPSDATSLADGQGAVDVAGEDGAKTGVGDADNTGAGDLDGAGTDGAGTDAVTADVTSPDAGSADAITSDSAGPCVPTTPPKEVCDGLDNDCDGQTDNGAKICDDNNPCTTNVCSKIAGKSGCKATNVTGNCDDGNACTILEKCVGDVCKPGHTTACNDQNKCTADSCDPASGNCAHEKIIGCGLDCVIGAKTCPKPNFCEAIVAGACAGKGRCAAKAVNCAPGGSPVCGCDGKTYPTPCKALEAGVNVNSQGACP